MDVKTYCDNIGAELNSWKAKLYDVIRKTESERRRKGSGRSAGAGLKLDDGRPQFTVEEPGKGMSVGMVPG